MGRPPNKPKAKTVSPAVTVWGNVVAAMYKAGYGKKEVAAALGVSVQTIDARYTHPEKVTLEELQQLAILLGTPFGELVHVDA